MRRALSAVLLALILALTLTGCGPTSCTKDGGGTTTKGGGDEVTSVEVELSVGESAEFEYEGATHTAELVSVTGSSATIVVSSSPTTYQLTEGQPSEADLDTDAVPDTMLVVSAVTDKSATLSVNAIEVPMWDESDFTTAGGLAPYDLLGYYETDPCAVSFDDDSIMLFYTSGDRHYVQWERYAADGKQITAPQLGAGRVVPVPGEDPAAGEAIDVARIGDSIYMVSQAYGGIMGTTYDLQMNRVGQPSFLTRWDRDAALAASGDRLWMATQEAMPPDGTRTDRRGVAVMEIAPGTPMVRMSSSRVTEPTGKYSDLARDIAYDEQTGLLAVLYGHYAGGGSGAELRLVVVDPATLKAVQDVRLGPGNPIAPDYDIAVTASKGTALVFWRSQASKDEGPVEGAGDVTDEATDHFTAVDLRTGAVSDTIKARSSQGVSDFRGGIFDAEIVERKDGPALLYWDAGALKGVAHIDRFRLQALSAAGPVGDSIMLDGGQPILADATFDLATLRSNPKKAICGSPCLLDGAVVNRGSVAAKKVVLAASVDGESIGTLDLGTIQPGAASTFAKVWDVPAELTAEQATVGYSLTTESEQYTVDNDVAETTVEVRQKGLVQGRVTNASGVVDPGRWAGGLEGVEVSFGGKTVVTGVDGMFAIEEVEFGTGTLTASKEGFNPLGMEIETSRTRPIASAGIRMDNHGTLRFHVVDETGKALSGAQVFVMGYQRTDKTDSAGDVVYMIPSGVYRFAFKKSGYHAVSPSEYIVRLGEEIAETVTMREATTANLSGRVVDKRGNGVGGASVSIKDSKDEVVAQPTADANGDFGPIELSTKPSGSYLITATGNGVTVEEPISLIGGGVTSVMVELIPGRGELSERAATEGYTSWMIKAGWPGFLDVGGQSIYVWYGNYAMRVGAEYWDGSRELNRVSVTAWGGTYETHVTKGEIEFSVSGDDLTGNGGKKLPPAMGHTTDAASQAWWKTAAKTGFSLYKKYDPAINLAKEIYNGVQAVREAWSDESSEDWIVLGQGPELLTWKEALEDFNTRPSWDGDHPWDSAMSYAGAIPTSFAIPIVIGGSSVQETAARVDGVDVVDKETGEVYATDRSQWYSYDDLTGEGTAYKSFEIERSSVYAEDVRIFVWVTTQKYWHGAPGGTCFEQREKQVVIFDPGSGGMEAFIAPGDLYKDPSRWTTEDIARLTED